MKNPWSVFKYKISAVVALGAKRRNKNSNGGGGGEEGGPNQNEEMRHQQEIDKGVPTALSDLHQSRYVGVTPKYQRRNWHKPILIGLGVFSTLLLLSFIVLVIKYVERTNSRVDICETKECLRAAATIRMNLDLTADPCQDFYQYACGNWAEEHPKPDTANMNDWFTERQVRVSQNLRTFLKMNNSEHENEPLPVKQSRSLYTACMDTEAMNSAGYHSVEMFMRKIGFPAIPQYFAGNSSDSWNGTMAPKLLGRIKRYYGKDILIGWDIYPDPRNRSAFRMAVGTPETEGGLPFIEQYVKRIKQFHASVATKDEDQLTERDKEIIEAYYRYVSEAITEYLRETTGYTPSQAQLNSASEKIFKITKYVYKMNQLVENMNKSDNPLDDIFDITVSTLQNFTDAYAKNGTEGKVSKFPFWATYLEEIFKDSPELRLDLDKEILLTSRQDLHYMKQIFGSVLAKQAPEMVELFIWWSLFEDMMLYTTEEMRHLHRNYLRVVSGVSSSPSRSLYCTTVANKMMGMAVSYGIAEPEFLSETRPNVETMLEFIQQAFYQLVEELHWMDAVTKKETLEKAKRMVSLIGFPEWILNKTALEAHYYGIHINESDYLGTMLTLLERDMKNSTAQLRKSHVTQWATTPTNVNAFHTFQSNAITVPLAILQFPFYHLGLEALNYGAIGSILGHELTHGFDDSGRHYDKNGNMVQWWTNQTINEYVNRTKCFVEQYNSFKVPEIGAKINGERTLGENIADNGGLREAYMAYQQYQTQFGREQSLPGFESYTAEQLFFLSFGNLWCETTTAASLRYSIEDSHCPGRIRLMGVLSNFPDFATAFQCRSGDKMIAENKCRIW